MIHTDETIIEDSVYSAQQGWEHKITLRFHDRKLRVHIRRDHYKAQSFFRIYVWSASLLTWNLIHELPVSDIIDDDPKTNWKRELVSFSGGVHTPERNIADVRELTFPHVRRLVDYAVAILS